MTATPQRPASRRAEVKQLLRECSRADLTSTARVLLCAILGHADNDGFAWPGMHTLADLTGISESGGRKALRELENAGLVRSHRAAKGQPRIPVGNTVLTRSRALFLVWPLASDRGKRRFAELVAPHANVANPETRAWRVRVPGLDGAPMSTAALLEHLRTGRVPPTAMVHVDGMPWTRAVDVAALAPACAVPIAG